MVGKCTRFPALYVSVACRVEKFLRNTTRLTKATRLTNGLHRIESRGNILRRVAKTQWRLLVMCHGTIKPKCSRLFNALQKYTNHNSRAYLETH